MAGVVVKSITNGKQGFMQKRLKPYRKQLRGSTASCATSERWVRGGVGFVLGSMIGTMLGGGLAVLAAVEDTQSFVRNPWTVMLAPAFTIVGGIGGAVLGAHKQQC